MRWFAVLLSLLLACQTVASQLIIRNGEESKIEISHNDITTNLSESSFTTKLPWYPEKNKYSGFKVSELLEHLNINDAFSLTFVALNDYASSTRMEDILKYQPIIAYKMNDKVMKVRNKGPYWLVFNLDNNAEIDNAAYHAQMVWQIDEIVVHKNTDAK